MLTNRLILAFLEHQEARLYELAPGLEVIAERCGLCHVMWDPEHWNLGIGNSTGTTIEIHCLEMYVGNNHLKEKLRAMLVPKKGMAGLFYSKPRRRKFQLSEE